MKYQLLFFTLFINSILYSQQVPDIVNTEQQVVISEAELQEITTSNDFYVYFGSEVCGLIRDLPILQHIVTASNVPLEKLQLLCTIIAQDRKTAPRQIVEKALQEAIASGEHQAQEDSREIMQCVEHLKEYNNQIQLGAVDVMIEPLDANNTATTRSKTYCSLKVRSLTAYCVVIKKNLTVADDVTICGNLTVCGITNINTNNPVSAGCGPGPMSLGTNNATPLNLVTNGCSNNRLVIDPNGAVTINTPTAGNGLTVTGNAGAAAIQATGNSTTTAPALRLFNNPVSVLATDFLLTIDGTGAVKQSASPLSGLFIVNGCQPGQLDIGTNNATNLNFATNGCVNTRIAINSSGAVVVNAPSAGTGLMVTGNAGAPGVQAIGNNTLTAPALNLQNNPAADATDVLLALDTGTGAVTETTITTEDIIVNGCQPGPLSIGTSDVTSLSLATNGCTSRVVVDAAGAVVVNAPTTGNALTVTSNGTDSGIVVAGGASGPAIQSTGNGTLTAPALNLVGNPAAVAGDLLLAINAGGAVTETTIATEDIIVNGCQAGPVQIGTNNGTNLTLATGSGGTCTDRVSINSDGAVSVNAPTTGAALTVTGNVTDSAIVSNGNGTLTAPALNLQNNPAAVTGDFLLAINVGGAVTETTITPGNIIVNGCQTGPLSIGTSDATSLILATNGCSTRIEIDPTGAVSISPPDAGNDALTVTSNATDSGIVVTGGAGGPAIQSTGDGTLTAPALNLAGNPAAVAGDLLLAINVGGAVTETTIAIEDIIVNGCQAGPVQIGTNNGTNLTLATGSGGTCTDRVSINPDGAVSVNAPTTGVALTVTGNATSSAIVSNGNGTLTGPALTLVDNPTGSPTDFILTINGSDVVTTSTIMVGSLISTGCQFGPLTIGTNNATPINFATNGCNNTRMIIDQVGDVTVTVGDVTIAAGDLILPQAGSSGLIQLGGGDSASATNVRLYEFGPRNFFAGNGAPNLAVTGTDNISIGSSANSTLTTANNTIAIGSTATATATDSIAVGDTANTTSAQTIVIGSRDSTSTGVAPTAGAANGIAIGSASGANAGANAGGLSSIAIGGADGATFTGATSAGARAIAVGLTATASAATSIALGSASGTAGGNGPVASTNANTIAIGSGNAATAGPVSSGASSIAIGGADGTFAGSAISGSHSIGIGVNANTATAQSIVMGSASGVGGGVGPSVAGINGIAIGSANGANIGAVANGVSSVAIGGAGTNFAAASATGARAICIGLNANSPQQQTIVIGAASDTVGGIAPTANGINGIAIGSANGASGGATAAGLSSVAIGGADGAFGGATSAGARSVAVGLNATSSGALSVALGSASGTVGGTAPTASNTNTIAVGSASGALPGPVATAASSIAIGSSDGTFAGASAAGVRSVCMGVNANTTQALGIAIGSASGTLGGAAPTTGASGTNAIAIGSANTALAGAAASNTSCIAIGGADANFTGAIASATHGIAIGVNATSNSLQSIALGSASGVVGGTGPLASNNDSIAIGSANGANAAALSAGISSIAIGGADAAFAGAAVQGARSICIGLNANTSQDRCVIIGSASGTAGGTAPTSGVTGTNTIVIGSGSGAIAGPSVAAPSAIAIGSSDGTFAGANVTGTRGIAIGVNANTAQAQAIVIGSASGAVGGVGPTVGGANGIAIGSASAANAGASAGGLSSIAIGGGDGATFAGATSAGGRSIAIGLAANSSAATSIAIGSASGTAGGTGPVASTNGNTIAIGSANGATAAPTATGISSIAIGGADGTFAGASTTGSRSICIGINATTNQATSIAIGSASGTAGGNGASVTTNLGGIAIGAGNGALRGALATGVASIAIGSGSAVVGATASGARSVAIGNGANTAQADAILLGNAGVAAVRVGIGNAAPTAKLQVAGAAGTPVVSFNAGSVAFASAPVLTNLVTSGIVDTLSINGANQVFRVSSSIRFKENLRPIDPIADTIYELTPLMFDYKEENGGLKDYIGFIAEDVAPILPSLVNFEEDGVTPRSIKYECLHALAIKTMQVHKLLIDQQKQQIETLQQQVIVLQQQIAQLQQDNQAQSEIIVSLQTSLAALTVLVNQLQIKVTGLEKLIPSGTVSSLLKHAQ